VWERDAEELRLTGSPTHPHIVVGGQRVPVLGLGDRSGVSVLATLRPAPLPHATPARHKPAAASGGSGSGSGRRRRLVPAAELAAPSAPVASRSQGGGAPPSVRGDGVGEADEEAEEPLWKLRLQAAEGKR
jgi:hypothetical protein